MKKNLLKSCLGLILYSNLLNAAQESTLLGPDADKNGIRDDVQAWINTNYSNEKVKIAAEKFAEAFQNSFINKDDKLKSIESSKQALGAMECFTDTLMSHGMSVNSALKEVDKLKLLHQNTKERILAQRKINENFSGSSYTLKPKSEVCNSDRDASDSNPIDQNSTLLGFDADKDGVRDDVQNWINQKFSDNEKNKIAAINFAKALQNGIANKDNKANSIEATKIKLDANSCLFWTLTSNGDTSGQARAVSKQLTLMHENTKERILASQKQSENFSGNSIEIKSKHEACGNTLTKNLK